MEHSRFSFTIQCTYFYFDRYGKLLKVLLQLLWLGRKNGADLSDDYWFIVKIILTEKTKFFKSHFKKKDNNKSTLF
jgi:gliding motility-associated-like protein